MQFEKNGRKSCGPNSRHIDIRYFWIKDDLLGLDNMTVVLSHGTDERLCE
jgi:hypothetical protein